MMHIALLKRGRLYEFEPRTERLPMDDNPLYKQHTSYIIETIFKFLIDMAFTPYVIPPYTLY